MIRAVLDSNVLVSGLAGKDEISSTPGELIRRWHSREFDLVVSHHILWEIEHTEIEHTLLKPYFQRRLTLPQVTGSRRFLRTKAEITPITVSMAGYCQHGGRSNTP